MRNYDKNDKATIPEQFPNNSRGVWLSSKSFVNLNLGVELFFRICSVGDKKF